MEVEITKKELQEVFKAWNKVYLENQETKDYSWEDITEFSHIQQADIFMGLLEDIQSKGKNLKVDRFTTGI